MKQLTRALVIVLATILTGCTHSRTSESAAFSTAIAAMEQDTGGIIGVYAVDTETGRELAHRADQRFAMASTFKPLLVAAVLARVDAGELTLDDQFAIDPAKIVTYSPVIKNINPGQAISLNALCDAVMTISDNTAANMLLELIGGPEKLTQFLRHHHDDTTRFDRYETDLNTNTRDDVRDTTTPRAMVNTLSRLLFSDVLSQNSRMLLQDWLVASKTGSKRLRAGLPASWRTGDKTGTGLNGAANNTAITWPPGRQPIVIAVYMSWSEADTASLNVVHAAIADRIVAKFQSEAIY